MEVVAGSGPLDEAIKQVQRLLTEGIKGCYQVPRQVRGRRAINPEKSYYISGFTEVI